MAKKNVTFADIAAYTGFSKTTISRYFNNPDSITVENQEKIANALEVLDYKENKLARVMANGKTEMVWRDHSQLIYALLFGYAGSHHLDL